MWPFWARCTGWWSPWCWIDEICHAMFPMTFGFRHENGAHFPDPEPWICRKHSQVVGRWYERRYPE